MRATRPHRLIEIVPRNDQLAVTTGPRNAVVESLPSDHHPRHPELHIRARVQSKSNIRLHIKVQVDLVLLIPLRLQIALPD
jgi:hypothetical protein